MEGGSLQDRLACRGSGALVPLTVNERIVVLSDVARGLAYLHSQVRVVHRDVKSANVLLDEGCRGRIGDFDIAKSLKDNGGGHYTCTPADRACHGHCDTGVHGARVKKRQAVDEI